MRKTVLIPVIMLGSILVLLAAGCYSPGGPIPQVKRSAAQTAWTSESVDDAVSMTMESIYSPAPTTNGVPPEECNYINYLRFRPVKGSGDPLDADAIIVLIPGFLGGANSLEYISRQMVYMAQEQRGIDLEVWVVDRRPNNLEDLTGLNAAEQAHDTQVAIDYYYNGAEIDGRKFAGFLNGADEPYLSEFGLELSMRDIYTVITTNVPDPEMRRQKVFVGGHSMGGPYTAYFAGWDFDGDPTTLDDAGYMNCAGLIGLDTMLITGAEYMQPSIEDVLGKDIPSDAPPTVMEGLYATCLQWIREGSIPRILTPAMMFTCPEVLALQELMGMEAAWHPDQESDLLDRVPYTPALQLVFQVLNSKDYDHFIYHSPSIRDFRFTNEALVGIIMDDNFQPVTLLKTSLGFLGGGAVVPKQFPLPQDWANVPELSVLKSFVEMDGLFIANDAGPSLNELGTGPLYTWINFDEIEGDLTDTGGTVTFTTAVEEVSDIQDAARMLYEGPANALEWYFASRPFLDMYFGPFAQEFGFKYGLDYFHGDKAASMPQIDFIAEKGLFNGMVGYPPPELPVLEGYNHLDVCLAAADRPSRRPNEFLDPILDFVLANLSGKE